MELIMTLAMKFWQWTILIAVVIIAAIMNAFDKKAKPKKIGIKISKVIVSAFSKKKANSIIISIGLYYL